MSQDSSQPNTSISTGMAAMFQAAATGGDLKAAFNNPGSVQAPAPIEETDKEAPESGAPAEDTSETINVSERSDDEPQTDSSKPKEQAEKAATNLEDIEEITFTDHKGRRSVKVDFSDRDKVKKLASLAYGSRKFQVERDQVKQELAKQVEDTAKLKADMDKFETVYAKQGLKGLITMLEGPEGLDKFVKDYKSEQEKWEDMTPAERNAENRAREAQASAEKDRASKEDYEKRLAELDKRQTEADNKAFESKLHPAFDRYRFAGKLGDAIAEHRLDQAVWSQAMDALQPYEDKGVEITQAMIDKEFRKASQELSSIVNKQVDKKTKVAVQKAKTNAQSKAQATVSKGMKTSSSSEQFKKDIGSGNIRDALRSVMSGAVKLTR